MVSRANFIHGRLDSALTINKVSDAVSRKPSTLWHHEVGDQCEDGDSSHDNGGVYQAT